MDEMNVQTVETTEPVNLKRFQDGKKWRTFSRVLQSVIVVIGIIIILFPILWMIPTAFKTRRELYSLPTTIIPVNPSTINFERVFTHTLNGFNYPSTLFWTLVVSLVSVALGLAITMVAAYAFARLEFRGKSVLWWYLIITMFIPGISIQLTSIRVVSLLGLTDTIWVLILPGLAGGYGIFFFRQFFLGLPASLEEAAMIDGCPVFQIFLKIFVPMSLTPVIIIATRSFTGHWNSYMWPTLTIINNPDIAQVMQVIRMLHTSFSGDYGVVIAATIIATIIPLTLYAIFQRQIVAGIAISGLK